MEGGARPMDGEEAEEEGEGGEGEGGVGGHRGGEGGGLQETVQVQALPSVLPPGEEVRVEAVEVEEEVVEVEEEVHLV